jgi:class 3 adenylate cyclase
VVRAGRHGKGEEHREGAENDGEAVKMPDASPLISLSGVPRLGIDPVTLRFREPAERLYQDDAYPRSLVQVRAALGALCAVAIFAVITSDLSDLPLGSPSLGSPLGTTPQVGIASLGALLLGLSFHSSFRRWMQTASSLVLLAVAVLIALQFNVTHASATGYTPLVGLTALLLAFFWAFTFSRMSFVRANFTALVSCAIWGSTVQASPVHLLDFGFFLVSGFGLAAGAGYFLERSLRRDFARSVLLAAEGERSNRLLLNVLPAEIAERLKRTTDVIADAYPEVSILFADIVGFTPLSSVLPPHDVVNLLNEIFSSFDDMVDRAQLEKIRTIGDGYMVVSGVPRQRSDHAQAICALALEMRDYIRSFRAPGGRSIDFRIGINSGPVVAGVIGRKKFQFDLWGDPVNVASRMESHGVPGWIQISDVTHELVRAEFECERRGPIEVKGKGLVTTYFVRRRMTAAT